VASSPDPQENPPRQDGSASVLQEVPGVAKVIGVVITPVTLITALLIFFGWSRTTALFGWFGVDPTSLGFSTTDYLLTSQDSLFVPGVALALLVLGVMWLLAVVRRSGQRTALTGRWVGPAAAIAGGVLATNGVLGIFGGGLFVNRVGVAPLCLILGVALLSYAVHTIRARRLTYSHGAGIAELTGLTIVMAMALFWAAGDYSSAVGRQRAADLAAGLDRSARVVLYSEKSLGIPAEHGVQVVRCAGGASAAYAFRYSGLMLLLNSNGQYIFLPVGWTRQDGSAFAVPKDGGVRLDYRSAGSSDDLPPSC
jgi:hypothetical protein